MPKKKDKKDEMTLGSFMKSLCKECKDGGGEKAYRLASIVMECLAYGEAYNDLYVFNQGVVLFLSLMEHQSKALKEMYACVFSNPRQCRAKETLYARRYYETQFVKKFQRILKTSKRLTPHERRMIGSLLNLMQFDILALTDAYLKAQDKDFASSFQGRDFDQEIERKGRAFDDGSNVGTLDDDDEAKIADQVGFDWRGRV